MSKSNLCPRCSQPLPPQWRGGVYLPPKKAAIFDAIARRPGISIASIITTCFDGDASAATVKQHVHQINCLLAGSDIRISGTTPAGRGDIKS
jgi:hypothetical protein